MIATGLALAALGFLFMLSEQPWRHPGERGIDRDAYDALMRRVGRLLVYKGREV